MFLTGMLFIVTPFDGLGLVTVWFVGLPTFYHILTHIQLWITDSPKELRKHILQCIMRGPSTA